MKNSTKKRGYGKTTTTTGNPSNALAQPKKRRILRIVLITFLVLVLVVAVGAITAYFGFMRWADGVTLDENLLPTARALPTFYDADGNKIPFSDDRYIKDVPDAVRGAFIALEDRRFYSHKGYDIKAMARAAWVNLKSGGTVEGASTITQQLVKNTHLGAERTLSRKLKEIALAMKIEEKYTKDEILSMYLSVIYFGAGAYGIKAASRVYFGCTPDELTLSQAATLAGIVKNPSRYSPKNSVEEAEKRRNLVLDVMCREGYIRSDERDAAKREKIVVASPAENDGDCAKQYIALVADEVCDALGITEYQLGNSGLSIYTAYDPAMQSVLVDNTVSKANYSAAGIDGSASVICNATGEINAYYSTTGYEISRGPGSAIKPLAVYAPALEEGKITLATPIRDEKTDFGGYSPQNFDGVYYGDTTPREALKKSMNSAAVRVLTFVGAEKAAEYCSALGIEVNKEDANLALALGATGKGVNTNTLAAAYSTFARGGEYIPPHTVRSVVKEGKKVFSTRVFGKRVFSPETATLITDCLCDTAKSGTARTLSALPFRVAAKTGTVQSGDGNNTDAWSVSYTSLHTLAVWHGADKMDELGGGHATRHAASIWRGLYGEEKPADFTMRGDVVRMPVDTYSTLKNRMATLADESTPERYLASELFDAHNLPVAKSRFCSPTPEFTLSVEDGRVKITLLTEPAFGYAVTATDALGTRTVGEFSPQGADSEQTASPDKERYPDAEQTVYFTPFTLGGRVRVTVEMKAVDGEAVCGSASKDCFPFPSERSEPYGEGRFPFGFLRRGG